LGKKEEDVVSLIAAKKYAKAIEVLKLQLQKRGANPSLRMQLADVLILADKKQEAVALLIPLADQFARDGFAAKAVSVLKKIQKVDPGRRDVEERLARQIESRQREAASLPLSRPGREPVIDDGTSLEIGFDAAPISAPPTTGPEAPIALPERVAASPPDATVPAAGGLEELPDVQEVPSESALVMPASKEPSLAAASQAPQRAPMPPRAEPPAASAQLLEEEDYDLMYIAEAGEEAEEELLVPIEVEVEAEAELVESGAPAAEPMSAGQFADELMGLVDSVFQEFPQAAPAAPTPAAGVPAASNPDRSGSQIVVSPLFRDFSVDEMVAVIQGLKLLNFERGTVILREGSPGGSLYMLTSGRVRAFKKDGDGKQKPLGDLKEGAFFGEMSILTGQPRMASVVALARCELLELDRPTLDGITKTHPHVWDVLREFAQKRASAPPPPD
jgi:hypothetical protein